MIAINLFATISNLQNEEAVTLKCLALEIILKLDSSWPDWHVSSWVNFKNSYTETCTFYIELSCFVLFPMFNCVPLLKVVSCN